MNIEQSAARAYTTLLEAEQSPPQPDERLTVGAIHETTYEYEVLADSGVSKKELSNGNLTRAQLLDAGFCFYNRLGGGEKPLVSTYDPDTNGTPFSKRLLLTADELAAIEEGQRTERLQAGIDDEVLEEIRECMIYFLVGSVAVCQSHSVRAASLFKEAQAHIVQSANKDDIQQISSLFQQITQPGKLDANMRMHLLMEQCLANIDIDFMMGMPIATMPTRFEALRGVPSPFLDSGFHFETNHDITLFPNDPTKTRRLNMATVHLLSRGLDEVGSSTNGSHDQTYITAAEFSDLVEGTPDPDTTHDERVQLVAQRLIAASW